MCRVWGSKLLEGCYTGDHIGTIMGITKGDTRSLDYSPIRFCVSVGVQILR